MPYQIHRGEVTAELTHPSHTEIKITVRKLKRLDLIRQYAGSADLSEPDKIEASLDLLAQQIVKVEGITDGSGTPVAIGTKEERRAVLADLFEAEDLDIPRVVPAHVIPAHMERGRDAQGRFDGSPEVMVPAVDVPETTVPLAFPIWLIEKVSDGATFGIDPTGKGSAA